MSKGLEGKVAFITGAAHGQGRSHALHLARDGVKIVAVDICENIADFYDTGTKEELDETVELVKQEGSDAIGIVGDVRSSADMKAAVDQGVEQFGTIDILLNNAGMIRVAGIDELTDHDIDVMIDICLKGIFHPTRFIAPIMKQKREGKIVNTSSAGGLKALPYVSPYAAAKGGVVLATKSWANELSEWDINVNGVAPGTIKTQMIVGLAGQMDPPQDPDTAFDQFNENNMFKGPRGHVTVDDISRMIVFLCSDEARMITGQVFPVDAGWVAS